MKALVLGCGRSGKAAKALLKAQGVETVVLADDTRDKVCDGRFDLAVVSPGIALTHPWVVEAKRRGIPLKSELQLGCEELKRQGWKLLAVTGSKGKSSVVKVVAGALGGVPCGNYGLPVCEVACRDRNVAPPLWADGSCRDRNVAPPLEARCPEGPRHSCRGRAPLPPPRFYSEDSPTERTACQLPHWNQENCACFVTWRTADSIPREKLDQILDARTAFDRLHPQPWTDADWAEYDRTFETRYQAWLDEGSGACVLRDPEIRQKVEDVILRFDGTRYVVYAMVVMPNHVHVLFMPMDGSSTREILRAWKGVSARVVNEELLSEGTFWQKESWDCLVRNGAQFERFRKYILGNDPLIAFDGMSRQECRDPSGDGWLVSRQECRNPSGGAAFRGAATFLSRHERWAVVEVSSFMMETTMLPPDTFEAAAILNLQEDHLDRHGSVEVYHGLKRKLLTMAKTGLGPDATGMSRPLCQCGGQRGRDIPVAARILWEGSYFDNEILSGNAAMAVELMRVAGLDDAKITAAFKAFKPLPHRMNLVAEIGGVRYIDDSKATSLAALIAGVKMASSGNRTIEQSNNRTILLIAGGLPKGDAPETALATLTERVKKVYLIGQSAETFAAAWNGAVDCEICGTMDRAVGAAMREAEKGETVLLSPGTASFDQFQSYGERGDVFARLVKKEGQPK